MKSISHISCYEQIHKFQSLVKLFNSSANIKLSKTQLHKIGQSGGFLGRLLGTLLKTGLPSIGNVLKPLAKSALVPLGLKAAASATNAAIHKNMLGSGFTTLIISNEEVLVILIKSGSSTIKTRAKEQKGGFLRMLLGTLRASLFGNLLPGKDTIKEGEGTIRAGENF